MLDDVGYSIAQLAAANPLVPILLAIIIFISPLLLLRLVSSVGAPTMVLESLGFSLPFSWGSGGHSEETTSRKLKKKKHGRSRSDSTAIASVDDGFGDVYPGLVNVSGTYCFMNSTLQALASLSYLRPYLDDLHDRAVLLDVPSPVLDALRDTLAQLNTPHNSRRALRPMRIIDALSNPAPGQKTSLLFSSMQHQDAQELFQLVSECVKDEAAAIDRESTRDRGLGAVLLAPSDGTARAGKGPFDGLTANRRSCVDCGYTEAVMHFAFDNWQLTVPPTAQCRLEDCLADYTRIEVLTDCICRRCSMIATHKRLEAEVARLDDSTKDEPATSSKKKRARATRRMEQRVRSALEEGRIEDDIKDLKLERVFSSCSTKQAMIARPPPVLVLHLNRSMHFGTYAGKNSCRVAFPEILDLTPFTTSGQLSTKPQAPISTPPLHRSLTPTPASFNVQRVLYRLSGVVCHYGAHSFGHYVAFRRKPPVRTPRMVHPLGCACGPCIHLGPLHDASNAWLRISDDSVVEVPIERVLAEQQGTFMLYYERIVQPRPPLAPTASEETLKPTPTKTTAEAAPVPIAVEDPDEAGASVTRARSVARVVHAFERASRSPSVLPEASTSGPGSASAAVLVELAPPPLDAVIVSSPSEPEPVATVVVEYPDPASTSALTAEDPATMAAKDIEEATAPALPDTSTPLPPATALSDARTEELLEAAPSEATSSSSASTSRISKRKGKVKRPPAASPTVVDLRA
ncbi:cysteine proteinase [Exidia glandulosa HHB12029]|uniref:ubiquitinyl hydrolase 1 n=1 Tax=Exidia glandulosa HHB12029 TaxID=1314781 RepID=A0A165GY54_EXIGL|nr:cysteine proteinase [Exidia glandulosa HHB12029]